MFTSPFLLLCWLIISDQEEICQVLSRTRVMIPTCVLSEKMSRIRERRGIVEFAGAYDDPNHASGFASVGGRSEGQSQPRPASLVSAALAYHLQRVVGSTSSDGNCHTYGDHRSHGAS